MFSHRGSAQAQDFLAASAGISTLRPYVQRLCFASGSRPAVQIVLDEAVIGFSRFARRAGFFPFCGQFGSSRNLLPGQNAP